MILNIVNAMIKFNKTGLNSCAPFLLFMIFHESEVSAYIKCLIKPVGIVFYCTYFFKAAEGRRSKYYEYIGYGGYHAFYDQHIIVFSFFETGQHHFKKAGEDRRLCFYCGCTFHVCDYFNDRFKSYFISREEMVN